MRKKTKAITGSVKFPCYDQFLRLAFAKITYRENLGDIETCLNSYHEKLYHLRFRGHISRSILLNYYSFQLKYLKGILSIWLFTAELQ